MADEKRRRCSCGALTDFAPQQCICGRKTDGCEHCVPGGRCKDCPPPPKCSQCLSKNIHIKDWDDREAMECHYIFTCRDCGYHWKEIYPFNKESVENEMLRRLAGATKH